MRENGPYSYSRCWTGTSLQWRLLRVNIIKKRLMSFAFEKTPCISLGCKLDPVQNRQYEYTAYRAELTWDLKKKQKNKKRQRGAAEGRKRD